MKNPTELLKMVQEAISGFEVSQQRHNSLYSSIYLAGLKMQDDLEDFIKSAPANTDLAWENLKLRAINTIDDLTKITGTSIIPVNTLAAHRTIGNQEFNYVVTNAVSLQDKESILQEFITPVNFRYQSTANGELNKDFSEFIVERSGSFNTRRTPTAKIKFELDPKNASNEYNALLAIVPR